MIKPRTRLLLLLIVSVVSTTAFATTHDVAPAEQILPETRALKLIHPVDDRGSTISGDGASVFTQEEADKKRFGFMIGEAIVEVAEVTFNGVPLKTAAVEHIDPDLVMSTVRELGLDAFTNINYVKAMKRAVGMEDV